MNLEVLTQITQLFESSPILFYAMVVVISLTVGSFLNVVVYRLPKMLEQGWYRECRDFLGDEIKNVPEKTFSPLTLSIPSSSCPHCQHKIRFYENIPVISWLLLKGQCSQCHSPISIRYPLVELGTAVLSFVVAYHFGINAMTFWAILLTWGLICLTLIDFDHMLLPDQIVLPLMWLGLILNLNNTFTTIDTAVIGAISGYMSLYSIFWIFKCITGKEGMGHGDFKLVALFGAWFGWQLLPLLILMASLVGAIIGIGLMIFKNHAREQAIPFGPYLAIAGWVCLLWGDIIWQWYLATLI